MSKKKLVVFYLGGEAGANVNESDYLQFYRNLRNSNNTAKTGVTIPIAIHCPTKDKLFDALKYLTANNEEAQELYFHFSGHGTNKGIPYKDWILQNDVFATLLSDAKERIKFCFFSSCRSSELVKLVNLKKIPVVIGTSGDNDIENKWAIAFQETFYELLMKNNLSFSKAFENAYANALGAVPNPESVILLKGEGASGEVLEPQINKLQIVFLEEKFKYRHLVAPNFLKKMEAFTNEMPVVLTWFDDSISEKGFFQEYNDRGFSELNDHLNIPTEELYLLEERGDEDPFIFGNTTLVLHITKEQILPDEIRKHLNNDMTWKMDNYTILVAVRTGIAIDTLFNSQALLLKIKDRETYTFTKGAKELFKEERFLEHFSNHEIPFAKRKEITLNFNIMPVKKELVEIADTNKFVRVFLGRNFNENLINFLINWIRSKDQLTCETFVFDNKMDKELDFQQSLHSTLETYLNKSQNFNLQFLELLKEGCILIFKNRHTDSDSWKAFITSFLKEIDLPVKMFGDEPPKKPSLIFFLQEEDLFLEANEEKIYLKTFSTPLPPNTEAIGVWQNDYSILKESSTIANEVKRVAESLHPEQHKDCCPSTIIECVCDGFNLPRAKITML